jgi:disulfide bond formation protein DsbB
VDAHSEPGPETQTNGAEVPPSVWTQERAVALAVAGLATSSLAFALWSERFGGLVPCALCLVERWPYRVVIFLSLVAALLPARPSRWILGAATVCMLAGAVVAGVHVGVEQGWWASPLPECAAPTLGSGTMAERLARMPLHPAKPCDDPVYFIPGVKLSMAEADGLFECGLACLAIFGLSRHMRRSPRFSLSGLDMRKWW